MITATTGLLSRCPPGSSSSASASASAMSPSPSSAALADRRPGSSRVRRPPKRLLSPPPPSRLPRQHSSSSSSPVPPVTTTTTATIISPPSTYHHHPHKTTLANAAAASKSADTVTTTTTTTTTIDPQPASARSASSTSRSGMSAALSSEVVRVSSNKKASSPSTGASVQKDTCPAEPGESRSAGSALSQEDSATTTGPGKRKRKPSTLSRPPSTITVASSSTAAGISGIGGSSSSSRDASSAAAGPQKSRASSSEPGKIRIKVRHSGGSSLLKRPNLPSVHEHASGYDSDGGRAGVAESPSSGHVDSPLRLAKYDCVDADDEVDVDDVHHLAAPPLLYQRSRSGLSGNSHAAVSVEGLRSTSSASALSNSRKKRTDHGQGHAKALGAHAKGHSRQQVPCSLDPVKSHRPGGHSRTKSMPSMLSHIPASVVRFHRSSLEADLGNLSGAETTDAEDEDDFHREMMEGDFDAFDAAAELLWTSKSGDLDTPATTPRSPQSTCDHLSDHHEVASSGKTSVRSSSDPEVPVYTHSSKDSKVYGKGGEPSADRGEGEAGAKDSEASRDSVFAHALPPSSRRARTHAGLLTLSLPYDECKIYSSPLGKPGTTTPTLERRANLLGGEGGERTRDVHIKEETDDGEESASRQLLRLLQDSAQQARRDGRLIARVHNGTTSPPLSPTQSLLKNASARDDNHIVLPGTASMTSSPFLSAVHHHAATISRPNTPPVGFHLPPSIAARDDSPAASIASTHQDLHDVSPFPQSAEVDEDAGASAMASASCSPMQHSDDLVVGEVGAGEEKSLHHRTVSSTEALQDPLFSLPETMDLDDIDVAYGGNGRAARLSSSQAKMQVAMVSSGESISLRVEAGESGRQDLSAQQSIGDAEEGSEGSKLIMGTAAPSRGRRRGVKRSSDACDGKENKTSDRGFSPSPARKTRKVGSNDGGASTTDILVAGEDGISAITATVDEDATPVKKRGGSRPTSDGAIEVESPRAHRGRGGATATKDGGHRREGRVQQGAAGRPAASQEEVKEKRSQPHQQQQQQQQQQRQRQRQSSPPMPATPKRRASTKLGAPTPTSLTPLNNKKVKAVDSTAGPTAAGAGAGAGMGASASAGAGLRRTRSTRGAK